MRKNLIFLVIAFITLCSVSYAQVTVVTGTVKAEDGTSLPGTAVQIKGTTVGVTTDLDGAYSIDVSGHENPVLVFTFVGYTTEEVEVGNQSVIDITMETDMLSVEELVVIGYGVQKKSLVTGSISKVDAEELTSRPAQRIEQALQGKISGVSILANSGSPGAGQSITIRGAGSNTNSSPLFIVDGMRTSGIDFLDPNDIESVEILKDAASAAIYGSEGGNGVVLITTKKGGKGTAVVNYNMYYGIQKYNTTLEVMDANQYVDYFSRAALLEAQYKQFEISGEVLPFDDPRIITRYDALMDTRHLIYPGTPVSNTNWIDEVTENAPIQSHHLSISGGSETTSYSGSVGFFNQDGVVGGKQANFKRYSFNVSVDHKQNEWLSLGTKINYSIRHRNSISENSEFGGVILNTMFFDPTVPLVFEDDSLAPALYQSYSDDFVRDEQGRPYGMSALVTNEIINPVAQLKNTHTKFIEDKILAGAHVEITPIKNLKVRSSVDVDIANNQTKDWFPKAFYNAVNYVGTTDITENHHRFFNWQIETYASYNLKRDKHNFNIMAGHTLIEQTHEWFGAMSRGLIRDEENFAHIGFAQADTLNNTHTFPNSGINPEERMESFFGRINYNYNEQLLLNLTLRRDGSSLLAPGYEYKLYPSVSVGYVLSNSSFWTIPQINYFKIRGSYGTNGNKSAIDRSFYYAPLITSVGNIYPDNNGTDLQGAVPVSWINEKLTWESVKEIDLGIDMNLYKNKLGFILNYFHKTTTGLLMPEQIEGYWGNFPAFTNAGEIANSGLEFELSYRKMEGDFNFEVNGNLTYILKNECVSLVSEDAFLTGAALGVSGPVTRTSVGEPLYYFYGYQTDGVWESWEQILDENYINGTAIQSRVMPGDIKIVDINNDSIIDANDKTKIGSSVPKVITGLNFNLYYKGFDLGVNFLGEFGKDVYNGTYRNDIPIANRPVHYYTEGFYPGEGGDFFRPTLSSNWNFLHNSLFIENGSFFRLKNLQLGYTLPKEIMQSANISKLRLYVSLNNIYTWTKYRGTDPEIGSTAGYTNASGEWIEDIASKGIDRGFYPQPKSFLFGLNVTF